MLQTDTLPPSPGMPPAQLRNAWIALHKREPGLRARELAGRLGVSEGQLLASRCGEGVTRLEGPWGALIQALPSLGHVMALTRNDSCVHEKKGAYDRIEIGDTMGMVLNEAIDLRLFLTHWQHGYAVREESRGRMLKSLQFFDGDGTAVHKIYATDSTDLDGWRRLMARFIAGVQTPLLQTRAVAEPPPRLQDDAEVDVHALRDGWNAMRDPHDFFAMLRRHRVTRTQALRLAGRPFARRVANSSVRQVLEHAAGTGLPLMVFVASPGVVQIHTGAVIDVKSMGPWLNVLDPDFNLHLRQDQVCESWVVSKPSPEGPVTSLELYDARGRQILQLFGKRKPGTAELPAWRQLTDTLRSPEVSHG